MAMPCNFLAMVRRLFAKPQTEVVSEAVYRDLVETVFTMRAPIIGLGLLYAAVGCLIFSVWPDPAIAALTAGASAVTAARAWLLRAYFRTGTSTLPVQDLMLWERRYARATYIFALLLAGLTVRSLAVPQPIIHMVTVSLIFTFGAGVVARTAGRPVICSVSIALAVAPTVMAFLFHAFQANGTPLQLEFSLLQAVLLTVVATMSLISARHQYHSSIEHLAAKHDLAALARSDPLTGLPNRLLLREAFEPLVRLSASTGRPLAIHYLDLDGFKAINDGYGHPAGDAVLREVAHRLKETVRAGDTVSRLGGDEFLLVQVGVEHRSEAEMLARRIIKKLSDPYVFEGQALRISVSIGIVMSPEFGIDLKQLIACADAALYRSKAAGKAQLNFYTADNSHRSAPVAA
jgi:diguanylate cyclase (GGDEF)-like protein